MDDEKLHSLIDFNEFEEQFKMGSNIPVANSNDEIEGLVSQGSKRIKRPELTTLLEHNRLRNIGNTYFQFIRIRLTYFFLSLMKPFAAVSWRCN